MLKNYFLIAVRNLRRDKGHAGINILGLAVGLACFLLTVLYVRYEMSYDDHVADAERIYRVAKINHGTMYKGTDRFAVTPAPLAPALREQYPDVETATTFTIRTGRVGTGDLHTYEPTLLADSHFFDVFSSRTVYGDPRIAFRQPGTVVLTESLAHMLFGDRDPVGEAIDAGSREVEQLTVAAVIEDVPETSHFSFRVARSIYRRPFFEQMRDDWGSSGVRTYFKAKPGISVNGLAAKLTQYAKARYAQAEDDEWRDEYFLQPLTDIHLHSHINFEIAPNNDIRYLYLFFGIGVVILLIACINYVNLATARATQRAKEVGVRKTVGARHIQLVAQFLCEAIVITAIASVLALGVVSLVLPVFSDLVARSLTFDVLGLETVALGCMGLVVVVGVLAGGYPAFVLAATKATTVLKAAMPARARGSRLRNLLVISQFGAAILLLISGVVIYRQLDYLSSTRLGFSKEQVVTIQMRDQNLTNNLETIRQELSRTAQVEGVTFAQYLPFNVGSQSRYEAWEGRPGTGEMEAYRTVVDGAFLDVLEISLLAGRSLPEADSSGHSLLLNETATRQLGWTLGDAIGKQFGCEACRVVGVVEDFHFLPLHYPMAPLVLYSAETPQQFNYALVRVQPGEIRETLAYLERTWKQFAPSEPFDYSFLDESYAALYDAELRFGKAVGAFTGLALVIACLGLFGLASFTVQRRTKEIGIRKVLGASVSHIVLLLSKEFTRLVLVAFLVATPVAYVVMQRWLEDFAYRVEAAWPVFALAGLVALLVAALTVSYQSIRAALSNPTDALRYE